MTTDDDKLSRQPDEDEPLQDLIGEVLDLTDQTVARITDADVDKHLRAVLTRSGYAATGEPAGPAEPGRSSASGIETLINAELSELMISAYQLLRDWADAEDAVQNACIKVWRSWPRVSMLSEEQQRSYLRKAVVLEALRIVREHHRKREFPEDCSAEITRITLGSDRSLREILGDRAREEWITGPCVVLGPLSALGLSSAARRRLWELSEARLLALLRDRER